MTRRQLLSLARRIARVADSALRRGVLSDDELRELRDVTAAMLAVFANRSRRKATCRPLAPDDVPALIAVRAEILRRLTSRRTNRRK